MEPWTARDIEIPIPRSFSFRCLEYLPSGPAPAAGWPLVLFLHGAGEKGDDLDLLRRAPVPRALSEAPGRPARIVCPQCPNGPGWPIERLASLLDALTADGSTDPDRVCVTGVSMGGRGTWELSYWIPDRLAAIVPLCGIGIPNLAPCLADLPVWAVHGSDDDIVPVARSQEMHDALVAAGTSARLSVLAGEGHDIGGQVYARSDVWGWMLGQHRARRSRDKGEYAAALS